MKRGIPLKGGDEYNAFTGWTEYAFFPSVMTTMGSPT